MKTSRLLKAGIMGTLLAAICCFTPILVVVLGGLGVSAWVAHLDSVLLPALFLFILLTGYAWVKQIKGRAQ